MLLNNRTYLLCVTTLALLFAGAAFAADPKDAMPEGRLIGIGGDKLVMTIKDGKGVKERAHMLAADVKVTLDGKACKAADLKTGTKIRLTLRDGDKGAAIRVEGIEKNLTFAGYRHIGKMIGISGNKLAMTGTQGKEEHTHTLTADVKVTCDGKVCKPSDLKPGMRIRVTLSSDELHSANRIEALDRNREFPSL